MAEIATGLCFSGSKAPTRYHSYRHRKKTHQNLEKFLMTY